MSSTTSASCQICGAPDETTEKCSLCVRAEELADAILEVMALVERFGVPIIAERSTNQFSSARAMISFFIQEYSKRTGHPGIFTIKKFAALFNGSDNALTVARFRAKQDFQEQQRLRSRDRPNKQSLAEVGRCFLLWADRRDCRHEDCIAKAMITGGGNDGPPRKKLVLVPKSGE